MKRVVNRCISTCRKTRSYFKVVKSHCRHFHSNIGPLSIELHNLIIDGLQVTRKPSWSSRNESISQIELLNEWVSSSHHTIDRLHQDLIVQMNEDKKKGLTTNPDCTESIHDGSVKSTLKNYLTILDEIHNQRHQLENYLNFMLQYVPSTQVQQAAKSFLEASLVLLPEQSRELHEHISQLVKMERSEFSSLEDDFTDGDRKSLNMLLEWYFPPWMTCKFSTNDVFRNYLKVVELKKLQDQFSIGSKTLADRLEGETTISKQALNSIYESMDYVTRRYPDLINTENGDLIRVDIKKCLAYEDTMLVHLASSILKFEFHSLSLLKGDLFNCQHQLAKLLGCSSYLELIRKRCWVKDPDTFLKLLNTMTEEVTKAQINIHAKVPDHNREVLKNSDFSEALKIVLIEQLPLVNMKFTYEECIHGLFSIFERLFGLKFKLYEKLDPQELWNSNVKKVAIHDLKTEEHLADCYLDLLDAPSKSKLPQTIMLKPYRKHPHQTCVFSVVTSLKSKDQFTFDECVILARNLGYVVQQSLSRREWTIDQHTDIHTTEKHHLMAEMMELIVTNFEILITFFKPLLANTHSASELASIRTNYNQQLEELQQIKTFFEIVDRILKSNVEAEIHNTKSNYEQKPDKRYETMYDELRKRFKVKQQVMIQPEVHPFELQFINEYFAKMVAKSIWDQYFGNLDENSGRTFLKQVILNSRFTLSHLEIGKLSEMKSKSKSSIIDPVQKERIVGTVYRNLFKIALSGLFLIILILL